MGRQFSSNEHFNGILYASNCSVLWASLISQTWEWKCCGVTLGGYISSIATKCGLPWSVRCFIPSPEIPNLLVAINYHATLRNLILQIHSKEKNIFREIWYCKCIFWRRILGEIWGQIWPQELHGERLSTGFTSFTTNSATDANTKWAATLAISPSYICNCTTWGENRKIGCFWNSSVSDIFNLGTFCWKCTFYCCSWIVSKIRNQIFLLEHFSPFIWGNICNKRREPNWGEVVWIFCFGGLCECSLEVSVDNSCCCCSLSWE